MVDTTVPTADDLGGDARTEAKGHFAKAIEEVKAGAMALGRDAQDRAGDYREKVQARSDDLAGKGREKAGEAKDKAYDYANQGKAKASEAISGLGRMVDDNAGLIDEKLGVQYGNYARSAAASMQDAAARLDEKSLDDLGDDAKRFVREKPAVAIGIAAAAGFLLARLFRR